MRSSFEGENFCSEQAKAAGNIPILPRTLTHSGRKFALQNLFGSSQVRLKELLGVTGYIRGGCSPIGMKKKYPTFIHETAKNFDQITVSAGVRGAQLLLSPVALADFVDAKFCEIV